MHRRCQSVLSRIARLAVVLTTTAALASGVADAPTMFARLDQPDGDRPRALQIAVISYLHENAKVDLVGAVHIGDPGYYAELNRRFRDYDAVLYELIAPDGHARPPHTPADAGIISTMQLGMTRSLGLAFQLDEVDYGAPNFVHADLSPDALKAKMSERNESLYVYFWRLFFAATEDYARDPLGLRGWALTTAMLKDDPDALKIAMAREIVDIDRARRLLSAGSGSAVIESRNERAIEVLRDTLAGGARRVAIFYGVAHLPDLEERLLRELGMRRDATRWLDAWSFAAGDER